MLIAHATTRDHRRLLLVGLSEANQRRLALGHPIEVKLTETQGPVTILLFGGEDEAALYADMTELLQDPTIVVDRYSTEVP
jgi:hypothetical protein